MHLIQQLHSQPTVRSRPHFVDTKQQADVLELGFRRQVHKRQSQATISSHDPSVLADGGSELLATQLLATRVALPPFPCEGSQKRVESAAIDAEKGDEQLVASIRAYPRPRGFRLRVLGKGAVVHTGLPGPRSLLRQQVRSEKGQEKSWSLSSSESLSEFEPIRTCKS